MGQGLLSHLGCICPSICLVMMAMDFSPYSDAVWTLSLSQCRYPFPWCCREPCLGWMR